MAMKPERSNLPEKGPDFVSDPYTLLFEYTENLVRVFEGDVNAFCRWGLSQSSEKGMRRRYGTIVYYIPERTFVEVLVYFTSKKQLRVDVKSFNRSRETATELREAEKLLQATLSGWGLL